MTISLSVPEQTELRPKITVFGVGGAGGNAVNNMIQSHLDGVEFVVANTDSQALSLSSCERRIQMGVSITEGLGAGSRPEIGRAAAEETLPEIMDHLSGSHMVFITAGMGGGTGTGAAPVIARAAKEQGILTVGVVTKPFQFEGSRRMRVAEAGIDELQQFADTLLVIPNQNLFRIANETTTFADAFSMADEVLHSGVRGITDLMVRPGLINLDFADVRAVMNEMGQAMMGTGEGSGEKRAIEAAEAAIRNPLLDDVSMKGARGVLINITGGADIGLYEVDEAANRIRSEVDPDANIIVGSTYDDELSGAMRVSVVATGIDVNESENEWTEQNGEEVRAAVPNQIRNRPSEPSSQPPVHAMTEQIERQLAPQVKTESGSEPAAVDKPDAPQSSVGSEVQNSATAPSAAKPQMQPHAQPAALPKTEAAVPNAGAGVVHTSGAGQQEGGAALNESMSHGKESQESHPKKDQADPAVEKGVQQPKVQATPNEGSEAEAADGNSWKGARTVFDRMMQGVKSARQANRASVSSSAIVAGMPSGASSAAARPWPQEAVEQPPAPVQVEQSRELFDSMDEEEQLEIPAFLRRQVN